MRTIPQRMGWVKIAWSLGDLGWQKGTRWMEWQEIKFILASVGLPVLVIACLVQLLPQLLRLL
jgi:hypothetical protein